MKGYAATYVFRDPFLRDLEHAAKFVERLPEKDRKDRLIRCHEVVRAVKGLLPDTWELQDGHYRTVEHSWLVSYPTGHILDLYSVARFPMVQLVHAEMHFHRGQYRPGAPRKDIRRRVVKDLLKAATGGV